MRLTRKCVLAVLLLVAVVFAAVPVKAKTQACRKITGDEIVIYKAIPYLGGRQPPGDSIGTTTFDLQAGGSCEKRLYVDAGGQCHVTWMKADLPYSSATRRMEWNFRYANGTYFGEIDASPLTSGYGSLDYTRDANLADQRTVISYHYNEGGAAGYFSWIDIDGGNGWGSFPNNPKSPRNHNKLWPMVARANNGNMVLVTDDYDANLHHLWTTTDQGDNWTYWGNIDSAANLNMFVIASDNPGSNKVAFVHGQFITDTAASGQLDIDVWYMVSTDGGVNWGPLTNLTQYGPGDTVRAYSSISAVFDLNDNLHIVWAGRKVDAAGNYYEASKIFHWDEVHKQITVVSAPTGVFAGGWWGWTNPNGYGGWRLPADEPLLVIDKLSATRLFCLWCGQADTADVSAAGWPNGDIYMAWSHDGGLTWSNYYLNLTNTSSPGAGPGECMDEDYLAVCPYIVDHWLYFTYIEDKDAGAMPYSEGDTTVNPVRLDMFPVDAVEERTLDKPLTVALLITPNPATRQSVLTYTVPQTGDVTLKVYGIDGRLVSTLVQGTQAAGVYTQNIDTRQLASGTYFVLLRTSHKQLTRSLVVVH